MTDTITAIESLSTKLCPWLRPALERLEQARVAERLGHAWLIVGPESTGKLNLALVFAGRLLAASPQEPAELGPAEAIAAMHARHQPLDHHPDLHWVFPAEDKRTIAVEQIRDVSEALALKAFRGRAKVVVIEPADAMTTAAANALLKTLEEPAEDTYLLLLSHRPGRLPATIHSRCQRVNVTRPSPAALVPWLGRADPGEITQLRLVAGPSPLALARATLDDKTINNSELIDILEGISGDKTDPQSVADRWLKLDTELVLNWLTRTLHSAIRLRLAGGGSTPVTDPAEAALHNLWRHLTLKALFEQYRRTEMLLSQLGTGVNVELALKALLVGFQPDRGRP